LDYLREEAGKLTASLNQLYREQVDFQGMRTRQKIAAGYLFSIGFNLPLPSQLLQFPFIKPLQKKGFIEIQDLSQKLDPEKVKMVMEELFSMQLVRMVCEDDHVCYICLNPS